MPVTLAEIQNDRQELDKIKDKTELKPAHTLQPGHIKYNNIAKLYDELKSSLPSNPKLEQCHIAFGSLVLLTKLTLQVGIMELRLGQQCKDRANRALEFIRTADNLNCDTYIFHALQLFVDFEISSDRSEIRQAVIYNIENSNLWRVVKLGANPRASDEMKASAQAAVTLRQTVLTTFAQQQRLPEPAVFHRLFEQYLSPGSNTAEILTQIHTHLRRSNPAAPASPAAAAAARSTPPPTPLPMPVTTVAALPPESDESRIAKFLWEEIKKDGLEICKLNSDESSVHHGVYLQILFLLQFLEIESATPTVDIIISKLTMLKEESRQQNLPDLLTWATGWLARLHISTPAELNAKITSMHTLLLNSAFRSSDHAIQSALNEFQHSLYSHLWWHSGVISWVSRQNGYEETLRNLVQSLYKHELIIVIFLEGKSDSSEAKQFLMTLNQWIHYFIYEPFEKCITQRNKIDAYLFSHIHLEFSLLKQSLNTRLRNTNQVNQPHYDNLGQSIQLITDLIGTTITMVNIEDVYLSLEHLAMSIKTSSIVYDRHIKDQLKETIENLTFLALTRLEKIMAL